MKKLFFLLAILLCSCHTAKVVTQQAQTVEETTTSVSYDTEKPIVQQTGKPPVKEEVTKKTVTHTDATGKVTTETKVQAALATADKTKIDKQARLDALQKETPVKPWVAYVWYILAILGLIALVLIVRHYWPKLKLLYGSVFHV